mgnify:CR=1 FL=1
MLPKTEQQEKKEVRKLRDDYALLQRNYKTLEARLAEEEAKRKKLEAQLADEEAKRKKLEESMRKTSDSSSGTELTRQSSLSRTASMRCTTHQLSVAAGA